MGRKQFISDSAHHSHSSPKQNAADMTASRGSICWQLWPSSIRHFYFPPISLSFSLGRGSVPGYNTQCWQWSMTVKRSTLGCRLQPESHTHPKWTMYWWPCYHISKLCSALCRWACEKTSFPQDRLYFLVSVDTHPIWHGVNVREHLPEQTACGTSGTFYPTSELSQHG